MKVRAKYNVSYNGTWVRGGKEFEISSTDDYMLPHVDVIETPLHPEEPVEVEVKRRGRRKAEPEETA